MIELRHLRYFIAVAEELSFRKAAERIHIDQSPLARTVRDLEEKWGVTLFVRTPRKLQLTPAGVKLLDHARKLLVRLERTKRAVCATDIRHREPLRIGVDEATVQPRLADCLARWRLIASDIPVELTEMRATELHAALRSEEVDAGLSFGLPDDKALAQHPAWGSTLVAILSAEHELAGRELVSLSELLSFPAIACTEDFHPGLYRQMTSILQKHALFPTIAGEARTLPGYLTRVAVGQGVGVADADHMLAMQRKDIVVVPLAEQVHITTYVLHKHQRGRMPESLQRFLTHATTLR
ncbi:LysR family transcriptional regulator [Variovorax sp. Root411]|uniref:LysR family transcriptional regulator n=1 Tax=Variovorax sp. Root411 TaxID=1736530 RepID=UPI0006F99934|nr:LysR family transcriptional regulator [Variovorax sp. Root411]KQW60453.1 LysR family transcriptional regulator [Variovorax sp. Root411]